MNPTKDSSSTTDSVRLPDSWKGMWLAIGVAGIVLLILSFVTFSVFQTDDKMKYIAHSYLANFTYILTFGLGATFFVIIQFLTRAGWSASVRRMAELISTTIPFVAVLFVPILVLLFSGRQDYLYDWNKEHLTNTVAQKAAVFLNPTFFTIRTVIYFAIWIGMATYYFKVSRQQDDSGDPRLTEKLQKWSGPMVMAYALSVSFASFDWVMSIKSDWYSTIFGVYIFAGSMYGFFALMICLFMALQNSGKLRSNVTVEHYHDMGKFLFGFTMFWSYIAFSQMMLYWYANIPEETDFFRMRYELALGWRPLSFALIIVHFILPWLGTVSRHVRRHRAGLTFWACWGLGAHWLDMTFLVLPNAGPASTMMWIAHLLGGLGMSCIFVAFLLVRATDVPLVAVRDPRLHEAMSYTNPIL